MQLRNRFVLLLTALLLSRMAEGQVVINEFLPDAVGPDGGFEWIELYNSGSQPVDISSWQIERASSSWSVSLALPVVPALQAGDFLVIGDEFVAEADIVLVAGATLGLPNAGTTGDGVRIVDSVGAVVDTVIYGPNNADELRDDNGNPGVPVDMSAPGQTIARVLDGVDTDDASLDFFVADLPTPGDSNSFEVFEDGFESTPLHR